MKAERARGGCFYKKPMWRELVHSCNNGLLSSSLDAESSHIRPLSVLLKWGLHFQYRNFERPFQTIVNIIYSDKLEVSILKKVCFGGVLSDCHTLFVVVVLA